MAPAATLGPSLVHKTSVVPTKQLHPTGILDNSVEHNEQVLREIRCLAADLVQQFNGGHPGTAMGAAAIGMALWGSAMRFNPADPTWIDRDRFVLSAGHACLLQYIYLHLTGYKAWTMDMLKRYHSTDFKTSLAAGHPEIDPVNGIEVTTGPLGQGISNAVGLAIASKHMAAHYNQPGFDIVDNTIWCFTGDGCIAEGVGVEGLSLAGHLGLDNLVLVYDCNKITVDGNIDSYASEDQPAKLKSMGWNVIEVANGTTDVVAIVDALEKARNMRNGKPTCVQIATIIGYGSAKQDTNPVHGAALGEEDVKHVKRTFGHSDELKFRLSSAAYDTFASAQTKGQQLQSKWSATFDEYRKQFPELAKQFEQRNTHDGGAVSTDLVGGLPKEWMTMLPSKSELPTSAIPTRKASGIVVQALAPHFPQFMVGSADLLESTFVNWKGMAEFQSPLKKELNGHFSGRQIRYGIREHAMAAIANGLAAYSTNGFIPVISTFFMFFLYAAPAIRMSALQKLRLIGIATHDSIGIGEDGPTHQPVGLASLFRAIPNLQFIRPADAEEVMGAWTLALEASSTPSILSLSRHALPLLSGSDRTRVRRGGYIVHTAKSSEPEATPLTLVATGSEVSIVVSAADILSSRSYNVTVVSLPCMSLFDAQPAEYRHSVISPSHLSIGVEAWASLPWPRYTGASMSMHTFGHSGPQKQLFEMFGFDPHNIATRVDDYAKTRIRDGKVMLPRIGEFEELLLGFTQSH